LTQYPCTLPLRKGALMTLMQTLRSRSRLITSLLLVFVVIAFTLFGLGVSLDSIFGGEEGKVQFEIEGVKVSKAEYDRIRFVWQTYREINSGGKSRQLTEDEIREVVGETMLARKFGFVVTPAEVDTVITTSIQKQSTLDYVLAAYKISMADFRYMFELMALREKYSNFKRAAILPPPSAVYGKYLADRETYAIKYTLIAPAEFAADVVVNDEVLKAFYDKAAEKMTALIDKRLELHRAWNSLSAVEEKEITDLGKQASDIEKEEIVEKTDIVDGPFANTRFIYVPFDEVKKDITVDPNSDEVRNYYLNNLPNYRKPVVPVPPEYGPFPPVEPPTPPPIDVTQPPPVPPAVAPDKDGAENAAEPMTASVEPPPYVAESEFKTLDEVRSQVVAEVMNDKAKAKAEDILTDLRTLIIDMNQVKFDFALMDPALLKKIADSKFPAKLDDVTVTPKNAETLPTYGCTDLKLAAFETGTGVKPDNKKDFSYWTHYSEEHIDTFSEIFSVPSGKYMFFVKSEDKAKVLTFDAAKAEVEKGFRYVEEKKKSKERAEQIIAALKSGKKVADLGPGVPWKDDNGTRGSVTLFLDKFGDVTLVEGMVNAEPIWIEDQQFRGWRIQVIEKVTKPTLADFAREFDGYRMRAQSDEIGSRPDQPKGMLAKWDNYDKKAYGLNVETPKTE